nr:hypothetical protein [Tanacetum cinerariifolium]
MDNKKHIVNLESFREMLHICPRLPHQTFVEPPFEEEILAFLHFIRHSGVIRKLTDVNINKLHQPWRSFVAIINKCLTGKSSGYDSLQLSQAQILWGVKHKDTKKSNERYYPRFTKVIIYHFMSNDLSIPRRNKVNWHYVKDNHMFSTIKLVSRHQNMQQFGALLPIELTNEDIRNSNSYKEYYAVATGDTPPKPKASVRKARSSSDTTVTPPTTVAGPRLTTFKKDKQAAKASKAKSLSALSEVAMIEAQQLKLATKKSLQHTHISQASGSGANKGTGNLPGVPDDDADDDEDDEEKGNDDEQAFDEEEFIHPSLSTHAEEETRDEESFDPIPKTPENTNDEGHSEENLGINVGREEGNDEEEEEDELYRDININQGRDNDEFLKTINENMQKIIKDRVKEQVKTTYAIAADLSAMELKKILIDKMEGNKYTVTRKRRRDDDANRDEEPFAGSDRGSKRHREGKEPESASAPIKKATRSDGKSTQGSKYRKTSASEFATTEEPIQTNFKMEEPSHPEFKSGVDDQPIVESSQHPEWFSQEKKPVTLNRDWNKPLPATHGNIQSWIRELTKQSDSRSSFNELMDTLVDFSNSPINRLKVDTLTSELLAGPTYELMKGSCKSLVEIEFYLEEVYKATTHQLDWVNPESASSRKYTTSVTKTKAADYGHIKWIKDLFYRFTVNRESARNVYSKCRIIAVTELKIVEWHNYKHLDWIMYLVLPFLNPLNLVLNPEPRTDFSAAAIVPSDVSSSHSSSRHLHSTLYTNHWPPATAMWQLPIGQPPVTWQPRQHRSTPVNDGQRRRPPSVNDGQRRWTPTINAVGHQSTVADHDGDRRSTVAVNNGRRLRTTVDSRWTTVDHHRTTGQW